MSWKPGYRKLSYVFSGRLIENLSEFMLGLAGRWPEDLPIVVMWLSAFPSALIGAFLGFWPSQTINNVVAGFFVLLTQPFKVKDYVRIGSLEGQVEEITTNYMKLYTPTFNLLKEPNTQLMNNRILNLTHEGFIKYAFTVGFSHGVPNSVLMEKCIEPALDEFHRKYENLQLRKLEAYIDASNRVGRTFLIRILILMGETKNLYVLKPELLDMIMARWYKLRNA